MSRNRSGPTTMDLALGSGLTVAGLFAGIGGLELGLSRAGHHSRLLCEIDGPAARVLKAKFTDAELVGDVRKLKALPDVQLVTAGFPCQDLSQAGRTAGIEGERSGLVTEVFRLLKKSNPKWLLLENVSFMLALDQGRAMAYLTDSLRRLGFSWAYRVVDSRAFGLPQRRQRVLLLASREEDPRPVLLADEAGAVEEPKGIAPANGFYWTEGFTGLGWAPNAVPTLKGGSTVGIPSSPAVWVVETGEIGVLDIRDAERLQGFPENWTAPAVDDPSRRNGPRWKLVGNAVSVPVAEWLGRRLREPGRYVHSADIELERGAKWPRAAWSCAGSAPHESKASTWPVRYDVSPVLDFLKYPLTPLSQRATAGFYSRTQRSALKFHGKFIRAVEQHLKRMSLESAA